MNTYTNSPYASAKSSPPDDDPVSDLMTAYKRYNQLRDRLPRIVSQAQAIDSQLDALAVRTERQKPKNHMMPSMRLVTMEGMRFAYYQYYLNIREELKNLEEEILDLLLEDEVERVDESDISSDEDDDLYAVDRL